MSVTYPVKPKRCEHLREKKMARKKGLETFNLSYIQYLMREQSKTTTELCAEIDVSFRHLSGVLTGQRTLSESIGKQIADALGVSWDIIRKPESQYMRELMATALVGFLQDPGKLDWKNGVRLADKMGYLSGSQADSSEPSEAEVEDDDLLELGDVPEADL